MQTAKNGGLFAVGALWGFRSEEELRENGADAVAERPLDLLRYIRENFLKKTGIDNAQSLQYDSVNNFSKTMTGTAQTQPSPQRAGVW